MIKKFIHLKYSFLIGSAALIMVLVSCAKDDYYRDGGIANPNFSGDMMAYLDSKSGPFDTLATVIRIAGLEENIKNDDLTFFAPSDHTIRQMLKNVNNSLYNAGKDTLKTLEDIDPEIWRKHLQYYMFKGTNTLKDYYQLDVNNKVVFSGQNYQSYNNFVFNVGVLYNDVNGIKYGGYRQIILSAIPDLNKPYDNWNMAYVGSSNIKPTNGVVHALNNNHYFGFNTFLSDILASK